MEIYFNHRGSRCKADVIYNFREIRDHVLIAFNGSLGSDLLFRNQNNMWVSDSGLQEKYPETYLNIQKAITEVFKKDEILYDLYLQQDLS